MYRLLALAAAFAAGVAAHEEHEQEIISGPHQGLWFNALPGDGGTQVRCYCIALDRLRSQSCSSPANSML